LPPAYRKGQKILLFLCSAWFFVLFYSTCALSARHFYNYVNIGVYVIGVVLSLIYVVLYGRFIFDSYFWALLLLNTISVISWVLNSTGKFSTTLLTLSLTSLFFYQFLVQTPESKRLSLLFMLAGTWAYLLHFTLVYFNQIIHPSVGYGNRLGAYFDNQNTVGKELAIICLLNLFIAWFTKNWLLLLPSLLSYYFIILTGSVSNTISCPLVAFVVALMWEKGGKRWLTLGIGVGLVIAFCVLINLPALSYFKTRILSMIAGIFSENSSVKDASGAQRLQGAFNAFYLFLEKPLFGGGLSATYSDYSIVSHNNVAEVASNYGVLGLIAEEFLFIYPLFCLRKKKDKISRLFFGIMLFLTFYQLFLISFDSKIENFMFSFVFAHVRQTASENSLVEKRFSLLKKKINFTVINPLKKESNQ